MSKEIEKKTWPEYFELIKSSKKKYECRLADFDVRVGDTLVLKEWDPKTKEYNLPLINLPPFVNYLTRKYHRQPTGSLPVV